MESKNCCGFTLMEIIIALFIASLLLFFTAGFLYRFYKNKDASLVLMKIQTQTKYGLDFIINGYNMKLDDMQPDNQDTIFRRGGLIWANSYENDPNEIELIKNNQWLKDLTACDPYDPNQSYNRIIFQDYIDQNYYIGYSQKDQKLYQFLLHSNPNNTYRKQIIPFFEGSQEYLGEEYSVDVDFIRIRDEDSALNPNSTISLHLQVKKDNLSFSLDSTVNLRNY